MAVALLGLTIVHRRACAQEIYGPPRVVLDQPVNIFASWPGGSPVNGFELKLPPGYVLRNAVVVRDDLKSIPVTIGSIDGGMFRLDIPERVKNPYRLVLSVVATDRNAESLHLTPLYRDRDGRIEKRGHIGLATSLRPSAERLTGNRVLTFDADTEPLVLNAAPFPSLATSSSFTVEFWMKTTALDKVVLSTWDGEEESDYPLEVVVTRAGDLAMYRGQTGFHSSMTSGRPVADGSWHHIAIANNARTGWARFVIDGVAVDSLFESSDVVALSTERIVVGARDRDIGKRQASSFDGSIDMLRIWNRAVALSELDGSVEQGPEPRAGSVELTFEQPLQSAILLRDGGRLERSEVILQRPFHNVSAEPAEHGVVLAWSSSIPAGSYAIERSTDGERYENVGTVTSTDDQQDVRGWYRYTWNDVSVDEGVAFYRISGIWPESDFVEVSPIIKVGLGTELPAESTHLIGNFPNPFAATTTVAYSLDVADHVSLSVWDLSGQRIAQLVDATQGPGFFEAVYIADGLPSGTYFLRMQVGDRVESRPIVVAR